jgi:serine/threonine-protein kinase
MAGRGRLPALAIAILGLAAAGVAVTTLVFIPPARTRRNDAHVATGALRSSTLAAVAVEAGALSDEVKRAAVVPQLRAALIDNLDAFTLDDLFKTEDWWEPYRARVLTLVGPSGPFMSFNLPGVGLASTPISVGETTEMVEVDGRTFLRASAVMDLPRRGRRTLLLGRLVDDKLMSEWVGRTHATLMLSSGRQILFTAGPQVSGPRSEQMLARDGDSDLVADDASWAAVPVPVGPRLRLWALSAVPAPPFNRRLLLAIVTTLLAGSALILALARRRPLPVPVAEASPIPAPLASTGSGPSGLMSGRISTLSTVIASSEGGQTLGRYTIIDRLGEGGMCDVYTAALSGPEGFQRVFVLKRLKAEISRNRAAVDQFIDEAKLGSSLVHSNIVAVFDFGMANDGYFIAQEYVVGRNVQQLVDRHVERLREPLDVGTVFYIATEILQALGYAHDKTDDDGQPLRIVHRDVSPGNIVVSRGGEVKLIDFGIVKAEGRVSQTDIGNVKGNAAFMAPEQARGFPVDRRTDLFSLALVMYRALAGRPLYESETATTFLYAAASGPTPEHFVRVALLPVPASIILAKALAPDPDDRYQSAEEMAADIEPHVEPGAKGKLAALLHALFGTELRPLNGGTGGGSGTSGLRRRAV